MNALEIFRMVLYLLFAYILGSIPSGLWICKLIKGKGFDIRRHGSCNIGAANVKRVVGTIPAVIVFFIDALKGFIPTLLALLVIKSAPIAIFCMLCAVVGHARSLIMKLTEGKFQGGKGVATSFGGIVAFLPWEISLSALLFFVLMVFIFDYISLASVAASWYLVVFLRIGYFDWNITLAGHQIPLWWFFIPLALFITYLHRRNLGQILDSTENHFRKKQILPDTAMSAFVIHTVTIDDLAQSRQIKWLLWLVKWRIISERLVRRILIHFPAVKVAEITGMHDKSGKPARTLVFGIPAYPEDIRNPKNTPKILEKIHQAVLLAERMGATVKGLGALLSTIGRGGLEAQKWAESNNLNIVVTNGGTGTAAAIILLVLQLIKQKGWQFRKDITIAVIGARGMIGSLIAKYFFRKFLLLLASRNERDLKDYPSGIVKNMANLGEWIGQADIVICATNSTGYVLTEENAIPNLKQGAVVIDVAVPRDFDPRIKETRPDLEVYFGGAIKIPGSQTRLDMHFGYADDGTILVPACLAETIYLSMEPNHNLRKQMTSLLPRPENVEWHLNQLLDHNFQVVASTTDKEQIFFGEAK